MNPINAKSVQLIELHAFACDLVCIYLSESFDLLKVCVLDVVILLGIVVGGLLLVACALLCATCLLIHLLASGLHHVVQVGDRGVDSGNVSGLVGITQLLQGLLYGRLLVSGYRW